jgi:hypothetical protein
MKNQSYIKPEIWVEELTLEGCIADVVSNIRGNTNLNFGGGGSGPARTDENNLWEDENSNENGSDWDQL